MELKKQLLLECQGFISKRKKVIEDVILEIETALLSETKSSAGDKHETGRAMLQLEREKAGNQLREVQNVVETLSKVNGDIASKTVSLGSIVYTTQANYFIAISAGQLTVDSDSFYAISPNTPMGQLLIGKTVGAEVSFNKTSIKILKTL